MTVNEGLTRAQRQAGKDSVSRPLIEEEGNEEDSLERERETIVVVEAEFTRASSGSTFVLTHEMTKTTHLVA